jgi:hypothetical protein
MKNEAWDIGKDATLKANNTIIFEDRGIKNI